MNLLPTGGGKTYLLFDIPESEGDIFKLPEMQEECDEQTFDSKMKSNFDF